MLNIFKHWKEATKHNVRMPGVTYGRSPSSDMEIVLTDPYQFSPSRIFIAVSITVAALTSIGYIYSTYKSTVGSTRPSLLSAEQKRTLTVLSILSIIASAIHNTDNFVRITEYFMADQLYHGWLFILDYGLYYYVLAAASIGYGATIMLTENHEKQQRTIALAVISLHCVMIWMSPPVHYSVEPMAAYNLMANVTIMGEGICAATLHVYVIYLSFVMSAQTESGSQYSAVPTSAPAVEMAEMSATAAAGTDTGSGGQPLRRRSKNQDNVAQQA